MTLRRAAAKGGDDEEGGAPPPTVTTEEEAEAAADAEVAAGSGLPSVADGFTDGAGAAITGAAAGDDESGGADDEAARRVAAANAAATAPGPYGPRVAISTLEVRASADERTASNGHRVPSAAFEAFACKARRPKHRLGGFDDGDA